MEWQVIVYRRWPWQDNFFSEREIGVNVFSGTLVVTLSNQSHTYNSKSWRRVVSKNISSRAKV